MYTDLNEDIRSVKRRRIVESSSNKVMGMIYALAQASREDLEDFEMDFADDVYSPKDLVDKLREDYPSSF